MAAKIDPEKQAPFAELVRRGATLDRGSASRVQPGRVVAGRQRTPRI